MIKRALLLAATALVFVLAWATPASAHAELESTDPANNAVLSTSPTEVSARFGESIELPSGALQVYNSNGTRVDKGATHRVNGDHSSVAVDVNSLAAGGYVATWKVISADAHPIHGAFTFTVGSESQNTNALAQKLLTQGKGHVDVGIVYAVFRALLIGSTVMLVGALVTGLYLVPTGFHSRFIRRLVYWIVGGALAATVAVFFLQGVYGATFGLSHLFDASVLREVLHERLGWASIVRLLALLAIAVAVRRWGLEPTRPKQIVYGGLAALVVGALTASGHAATGRWLPVALLADIIHVTSASAWVGGLIAIAVLWRRIVDQRSEVVRKFSSLAFASVIALSVTGVIQGWRQLGSVDALLHTSYGQILIVKVVIVIVMVLLGRLARNALTNVDKVIRSIRIEAGLSIAVFVATALLMNATPGSVADSKPFTGETKAGNTLVDVIIAPARTGSNSVHFYTLSAEGVPVDVEDITASLTLPSKDIGPVPVSLIRVASGHFASYSFNVPISGKWEFDVTVRTSEIDETTSSIVVPFK